MNNNTNLNTMKTNGDPTQSINSSDDYGVVTGACYIMSHFDIGTVLFYSNRGY